MGVSQNFRARAPLLTLDYEISYELTCSPYLFEVIIKISQSTSYFTRVHPPYWILALLLGFARNLDPDLLKQIFFINSFL